MEKKKEKLTVKIGRFCINHKEELLLGGAMLASFGFGVLYSKLHSHQPKYQPLPNSDYDPYGNFDATPRCVKRIDEDVFTNVAIQIEDLLLDEGLDEGIINTDYEVEFFKFGDRTGNSGTYTVNKNLQVLIRDKD